MKKIQSNLSYLFTEAEKVGLKVVVISKKPELYSVSNGKKRELILNGLTSLNSSIGPKISKDKNLTKKVLSFSGISVPNGILSSKWNEVLDWIKVSKAIYPFVVKPNEKALGTDVISYIDNQEELKKSFDIIVQKYGKVLVEEYFKGEDFRFFVLDYKIIAVVKRKRPSVVGDGKSTVIQLINKLDEKRPIKISVDGELERIILKERVSLGSVLEKGKKLILRDNSNFRTGSILYNRTKEVHKKYCEIASLAAKVLNLRICGVDILTNDIANFSKYVVTETNSVPGFDVHMETEFGGKVNVAKEVLEVLFKSK